MSTVRVHRGRCCSIHLMNPTDEEYGKGVLGVAHLHQLPYTGADLTTLLVVAAILLVSGFFVTLLLKLPIDTPE